MKLFRSCVILNLVLLWTGTAWAQVVVGIPWKPGKQFNFSTNVYIRVDQIGQSQVLDSRGPDSPGRQIFPATGKPA